MKYLNLGHFTSDLQEHLQNINATSSYSSINNDSEQLISTFEFLMNE